MLSLFKHEEPIEYKQCSFCEGEGVLEWTKITIINEERSIETPYLFHCQQCNGKGRLRIEVKSESNRR